MSGFVYDDGGREAVIMSEPIFDDESDPFGDNPVVQINDGDYVIDLRLSELLALLTDGDLISHDPKARFE